MASYLGDMLAAAKSALFGSDPKETGVPQGCEVDVFWNCKTISRLVHCMRFGFNRLAPLSIRDRQYHFRTYYKVFTGTEAVSYILSCEQVGVVELPAGLPRRAAASQFLHSLLLRKVFHHVTYEHGFQDADFFYRFEEDEGNAELNRVLCVADPCPLTALDLSLYLLENMASAILCTPSSVQPSSTLAVLCEHNCLAFKNSFSYYQLIWQTSLLGAVVGLESLDEEDRMCFWLNVHNLMCIHACVETFAMTDARKASVADGMEMGLSAAFYEHFQYRVQGEVYSLADIEQRCLRTMSPKSSFRRVSLGKSRFSRKDPRFAFACRIWDHRVNFAIINGTQCSGRVFFYRRGFLKSTLEECTRDFVRLHVRLVQLSEAKTPRSRPTFLVWLPRLLEEFGSFETTWAQLVHYLPLAVRVEVEASHLLTTNIPSYKFISNASSFHLDLRQLGEGRSSVKPSEFCPIRCNRYFEDDDRDGYSVEEAAANAHSLAELRTAFTDADQDSELHLIVREYLDHFRQEWGNAPCNLPTHPGLASLAEFFCSLYAVIAAPLPRSAHSRGSMSSAVLLDDEPICRGTEEDVIKLLEEVVIAPLFPELLDWYYRKFDTADADLLHIKQQLSSKITLQSLGLRPDLCLTTPHCYSRAIEALDEMASYLILSSSSVLANFPSMRLVGDCTPSVLVSTLGHVLQGITDSVQEFYEGQKAPQSLSADDLVLITSYAVTQTVPQLEGLVGFTSCLADLLQALDSSRPLLGRCNSAFFLRNNGQQYSFSLPPPVRNASFSTLASHHFLHTGSSSSASTPSSLSVLSIHIKSPSCSPCASSLPLSCTSSTPVSLGPDPPPLTTSSLSSDLCTDQPSCITSAFLADSSSSLPSTSSSSSAACFSCSNMHSSDSIPSLPLLTSAAFSSPSPSKTQLRPPPICFSEASPLSSFASPLSSCSSCASICSDSFVGAPFDLNFDHDIAPDESKEEPNAHKLQARCSSHGCQQYYQSLVAGQDGFCLATLSCSLHFLLKDYGHESKTC